MCLKSVWNFCRPSASPPQGLGTPTEERVARQVAHSARGVPPEKPGLRTGLLVFLPILGLTVYFFAAAFGGRETFVYRDAAHYYAPLFRASAQAWRQGRAPLWNPLENLGMPTLGDNTASVFYPAQILLAAAIGFDGEHPTWGFYWAYNVYVLAHAPLAAWGAARLARRWGVSDLAAGFAAITYAFSGAVIFQTCNVVFLVGAAWLPWALIATDRLLGEPGACNALRLAIVWALLILGGDPQMAYHVALLAALGIGLAGRKTWPRQAPLSRDAAKIASADSDPSNDRVSTDDWGRVRRRLLWLTAAGAAATAIAAVQVLPAAELAALSPRAQGDAPRSAWELFGSIGQPPVPAAIAEPGGRFAALLNAQAGGFHLERAYRFSVAPWRWAELVWPNISGQQFPVHHRWLSACLDEGRLWSPSLYAGALTLVFASAGWRPGGTDLRWRWTRWFTAMGVMASLGEYGIGWLVQRIAASTGVESTGLGAEWGGLYWWMNLLLPGYVVFRYPAKVWTIVALGISLLAARGWDAAWGDDKIAVAKRCGWLAGASALGAAVAVVARGAFLKRLADAPADPWFGPLDVHGAWRDVAGGFSQTAVVCSLAAALLIATRGVRGRWPAMILLGIVASDLATAGRELCPTAPISDWSNQAEVRWSENDGAPTRIFYADHWPPEAWARAGSPNRLREMARWERATFAPKYHLDRGLGSVESSGMSAPDDYFALWEVARRHGSPRSDGQRLPNDAVLRLEGATYAFLPAGESLPNGTDVQSDPAEGSKSYRVESRMDPAWIVHRVERLPPLTDRRPAALRARTEEVLFQDERPRNWREVAIVETDRSQAELDASLSGPARAVNETCTIIEYTPEHVAIAANLERPGLLVTNDLFYPGWEAMVEDLASGQCSPVEILRADRLLRGVLLPAGKFRVEYRFRPASVRYGAMLSAAACLVGLIVAVGSLRR